MRLKNLIVWELRFQLKYGFYFLYAVLTLLYVALLSAIPAAWQEKAAVILVFSDPAAMGLFFMGAVILLEKSQKIPSAFAVSPVRAVEYIGAKTGSMCAISMVVAAVLAIAAGMDHFLYTLTGTLISSILFTMLGIIIATKITSLNQFLLCTVPVEIMAFVPGLLQLFGVSPDWLQYYPANICVTLISGRKPPIPGLLITMILIGALSMASYRCVLQLFRDAGGIKL